MTLRARETTQSYDNVFAHSMLLKVSTPFQTEQKPQDFNKRKVCLFSLCAFFCVFVIDPNIFLKNPGTEEY